MSPYGETLLSLDIIKVRKYDSYLLLLCFGVNAYGSISLESMSLTTDKI